MAKVRAGELSFEYFLEGPASARHTLVLVHGWTYGARMWARLQPELAERGVRTLAVNQRGMGASDITPDDRDYGATQFALDIKAMVDALGIERFHLVGQCQGGLTALRYVERFPSQVQSLILIGSPTKPHPPDDTDAFLDWVERYPASTSRAAFDAQTRGLAKAERELLYRDWTHIPKQRLRGCRLVENQELAPTLQAITVPVLYCYGDSDSTVPMSTALRAIATIPPEHRSIHVFHGAEHMLPCLIPRQIADLFLRFLEPAPLFENPPA